jgi:hypothetical protein
LRRNLRQVKLPENRPYVLHGVIEQESTESTGCQAVLFE